jgi:hypothetical protein
MGLITAKNTDYSAVWDTSVLSGPRNKERQSSVTLGDLRIFVRIGSGGGTICMLICLFLYLPVLRASVC